MVVIFFSNCHSRARWCRGGATKQSTSRPGNLRDGANPVMLLRIVDVHVMSPTWGSQYRGDSTRIGFRAPPNLLWRVDPETVTGCHLSRYTGGHLCAATPPERFQRVSQRQVSLFPATIDPTRVEERGWSDFISSWPRAGSSRETRVARSFVQFTRFVGRSDGGSFVILLLFEER